ncbi:MAG: hypothetical protein QGI88_09310 [SAR202 cluster bacterium]|nr:hypothetical protein [SAR202 cluster bacterium]
MSLVGVHTEKADPQQSSGQIGSKLSVALSVSCPLPEIAEATSVMNLV